MFHSFEVCALHQITCSFFTRAAAGSITACIEAHGTRSPSRVKLSPSMAPDACDDLGDDGLEASVVGVIRYAVHLKVLT